MKNKYLVTAFCISILFVVNCKGKEPGPVTKLDNGKTIIIPVNKDLNVKLEANFSTGFSWDVVTIDTTIIKLKGTTYKSYKNIPGSNGMQQITFTPVSAGMTVLKLGYLRPWEGPGSMIDSLEITVKVFKKE